MAPKAVVSPQLAPWFAKAKAALKMAPKAKAAPKMAPKAKAAPQMAPKAKAAPRRRVRTRIQIHQDNKVLVDDMLKDLRDWLIEEYYTLKQWNRRFGSRYPRTLRKHLFMLPILFRTFGMQ